VALTIETGAVVSGADALLSLAAWKAYADAQGWDYSAYDDTTDIEPGIRRGSRFVSDAFLFKGVTVSRDQVFSWPRAWVTDKEGWTIASDDIPPEVERAVAEASWREIQSANSLRPDVNLSERVKSETVGPLSTTYADLPNSANASRPDVSVIRDALRGLLNASGGVELIRS
jgi:hypothetical protein